MADTNEAVMELVRKELERNPDASTSELFEVAKRKDPEMEKLTIRQFHARYPLQVKRKKALAEGGGRRKGSRKRKSRKSAGSRKNSAARDAVRRELAGFAEVVSAAADQPGKLFRLGADLDTYVDRILAAASK